MKRVDQQFMDRGLLWNLNIVQSESGVPYNVEILNSSDLSVHNGYECYWRVTFLKAEANQKLLLEYYDRRVIHFVLMNAEHELLKQLDLNTIRFQSSKLNVRRMW